MATDSLKSEPFLNLPSQSTKTEKRSNIGTLPYIENLLRSVLKKYQNIFSYVKLV